MLNVPLMSCFANSASKRSRPTFAPKRPREIVEASEVLLDSAMSQGAGGNVSECSAGTTEGEGIRSSPHQHSRESEHEEPFLRMSQNSACTEKSEVDKDPRSPWWHDRRDVLSSKRKVPCSRDITEEKGSFATISRADQIASHHCTSRRCGLRRYRGLRNQTIAQDYLIEEQTDASILWQWTTFELTA